MVLLQLLRKIQRVDGGQALVDIVAEFQAVPIGGAELFHQVQYIFHVCLGVKISPGEGIFRPVHVGVLSAVAAHLHADFPVAPLPQRLHPLQGLLRVGPLRMGIAGNARPAFSSEQLVEGHPRQLSLNIPQRHIHAGQRVVEHRSVAPIAHSHGGLPDILNIGRVLADQERTQIFFNDGHHRQIPMGKGGAAHAVQAGLTGFYLHRHQIDALRRCADGPYIPYLNSHPVQPPFFGRPSCRRGRFPAFPAGSALRRCAG